MAFRHFAGTPPAPAAGWKCPSCAVLNTGPLEGGCTSCHAGDPKAQRVRQPIDRSPLRAVVNAFMEWRRGLADLPEALDDQLQYAFTAGAAWAQTQAAPAGNAPHTGSGGGVESTPAAAISEGGWTMALCPADPDVALRQADPRTHATIVAALASYRDNFLAYGNLDGQLTAAEVSELILKLTPKEIA